MINFKMGSITNPETGVTKDIVVKAASPNTLKDIIIGGGMVFIGIVYLTTAAFRNGSEKFEAAECETLSELDLM